MVLEAIYVVRHGYRSNWTVDTTTGHYESNVPSPTGIASDPALASYGVKQAQQLGSHLHTLDPAVDQIHSSPFYRCLQTLSPFVTSPSPSSNSIPKITVEPGLGEFYGLARFTHPSPAPLSELNKHFPKLLRAPKSNPEGTIIPSKKGESIPQLHDRVAYCLDRIVREADADPSAPKAVLLCTHAAVMIAIGRALTGRMPESETEDDFQCFTCAFSKFVRRRGQAAEEEEVGDWVPEKAEEIPDVGWRGGKGIRGGWDCEVNGDCSFLEGGEERGWDFGMDGK